MTASGTATTTSTMTTAGSGSVTGPGTGGTGRRRGFGEELRLASLLRLALAGTRTDLLRVVLTAFSVVLATLAVLAALTVLFIPASASGYGTSGNYTSALLNEPGLRPGVAFALVLLTLPVLALAGQCTRLGAPARDRRLAAIRLAGGTPRQVVAIAATETGAASLLGSCAGLGCYFVGRELLHQPNARGKLPLPTDVLPPSAVLAAVVLALPLLATVVASIMMRRVTLTPFGVVRREGRRRAPRPWPGVLIALGVGAFAGMGPLVTWLREAEMGVPDWLLPTLLFGGGLCGALGVVLGTGWFSYTIGRLLHRFVRRPAPLLAARRLMADPWNGSRTLAALLFAVVFAAGAAAMRAHFVARSKRDMVHQRLMHDLTGDPIDPMPPETFYLDTMDMVDLAVLLALVVATMGLLVALAEGIVSRRRAHASLMATGVPRTVLGKSIAWQSLAPAVPATLLALTVGVLMGRGFVQDVTVGGGTARDCAGRCSGATDGHTVRVPEITIPTEFPLTDLALYGAGTLALVAAMVGMGLLFLRASTSLEELRTG